MSGVRHQRLARAHPVAVALQRVDLAVVGDIAVRVRERPRRERVGREAAVHQRQRRLDALVGQVGEELGELRRGEHALVDERAARQRREVDRLRRRGDLVLAALAGDEQLAVERRCRSRRGVDDEQLAEARASRCGAVAPIDRRRRSGTVAPAEDPQALLARRSPRCGRSACSAASGRAGRNAQPDAVGAGRRQLEVDDRAQEAVGHLDEDAGAVAGVDLGARTRRGGRGCTARRARSATMSWLATPLMSTTNETPQASCSKRGS